MRPIQLGRLTQPETLFHRVPSGMPEREVPVVNRGLLVEVMVVATFILVVLMMFGVRFGG